MEVWKIMFLSKWVICRFHVNLSGCTWNESSHSKTPSDKAGHSKAAHHKQKLPMQSQAELPHKDQVEPHLKLLLVRDWWRLLSWSEFQLSPSGHSIYNSCDDNTGSKHHLLHTSLPKKNCMTLKKSHMTWSSNVPGLMKTLPPPPFPHENPCLRELRFLHRIMALKVHLTGVDLLKHASWHFQKSQAKWTSPMINVKIMRKQSDGSDFSTWHLQPTAFSERMKGKILGCSAASSESRMALLTSCFTSTSWFFWKGPCCRLVSMAKWLDMDSRRKGVFFVKKWARFALMVSDGSSVPLWKDTNYVISYLAEIQEESSWLLHFSHIPTTSHETATPCLASTSVSPWVLPDLPDPEANGKTSLFWNKKTSNGWLISLLTVLSTGPTLPNIQDT